MEFEQKVFYFTFFFFILNYTEKKEKKTGNC